MKEGTKRILRKVGFTEAVDNVEKGLCGLCSKEIRLSEFRDKLSIREFGISGLCQDCQDEVFATDY